MKLVGFSTSNKAKNHWSITFILCFSDLSFLTIQIYLLSELTIWIIINKSMRNFTYLKDVCVKPARWSKNIVCWKLLSVKCKCITVHGQCKFYASSVFSLLIALAKIIHTVAVDCKKRRVRQGWAFIASLGRNLSWTGKRLSDPQTCPDV